MADLSVNDVLSVLNKMEQDSKFFEQMHATRTQIRATVELYQKATDHLVELTSQSDNLKTEIEYLITNRSNEVEATKAQAVAEIHSVRVGLENELQVLTSSVEDIRSKVKIESTAAVAAQTEHLEQVKKFAVEIADKTQLLASTTEQYHLIRQALDALKAQIS